MSGEGGRKREPDVEAFEERLTRRLVALCRSCDASGTSLYTRDEVERFMLFAMSALGGVTADQLDAHWQRRLRELVRPDVCTTIPRGLVEGLVLILQEVATVPRDVERRRSEAVGGHQVARAPHVASQSDRRQAVSSRLLAFRPATS